MAYRLEEGEELGAGLRRVSAEALGTAIGGLRDGGDEGIHDARTGMKRMRGLLRLARPTLGDDVFHVQHDRLRVLGKALSAARDAAVRIDALDELCERSPEALGERVVEEMRERLIARRAAAALADSTRAEVIAGLGEVAKWVEGAPLPGVSPAAIFEGLGRTYGAGRRRFAEARGEGDEARWHALRRRVKDLTYQVAFFEPLWPEVLSGMQKTLKQLGDHLGDDHDLALLRAELGGATHLLAAEWEAAEGAIAARSEHLRARSVPLARLCYAERGGRFTARIEAYWKAFHRAARG
ncbi:MAG: CHAD domain-containing protein [Byssovorax sp.]